VCRASLTRTFAVGDRLKGDSVEISITGRHVNIDENVKEYIRTKLGRIRRIFDRITSVAAVIEQEHGSHVVELVASIPHGNPIFARCESADLRRSIDLADQKLESQVRAFKERNQNHRS
jgi:putative sigma-54 modulation protein